MSLIPVHVVSGLPPENIPDLTITHEHVPDIVRDPLPLNEQAVSMPLISVPVVAGVAPELDNVQLVAGGLRSLHHRTVRLLKGEVVKYLYFLYGYTQRP